MRRTFSFYIILFVFFALCTDLKAQTEFYAKAGGTAYTGQNFKVSYILENGSASDIKLPQKFEGFNVLSGPNQSSSYQWVNGKTSQSITYYYILQAHTEGSYVLPAARATVKGIEYKTEALPVEVLKGAQAQPPSNDQNSTKQDQKIADVDPGDKIFVRLYADKTNPYVGEQITVYAKLYQSAPAYNTQITELPKFNGFWNQEFDLGNNQDWQDEVVNGTPYKSLLIGKYALFPQKDGQLTIEPFKLTTVLRVQEEMEYNPFDWTSFFKRPVFKEIPYDFQSSSLAMNVKPLPTGKPESFTGAVGSFSFDISVDSAEYKTGEAITVKSKLSGTGNIMMTDLPEVKFPKQLEVFDPQTDQFISQNSTYVNGNKSADYLIVADHPGSYVIPPVEFSYFDLKTESYVDFSSERITLRVTGESLKPAAANSVDTDPELLEEDIYFIRLEDQKRTASAYAGSTTFYSVLVGAPISALLFLFVLGRTKKWQKGLDQDITRIAKKKLALAEKHLKESNRTAYYEEVNRTLWRYLTEKLELDLASSGVSDITSELQTRAVDEALITRLKAMINNCEMALYSPKKDLEMKEDYNTAKQLIIDLENAL